MTYYNQAPAPTPCHEAADTVTSIDEAVACSSTPPEVHRRLTARRPPTVAVEARRRFLEPEVDQAV